MNTILTDDERPKLPMPRIVRGTNPHCYSDLDMEAYADAREAAVLAKLAQQKPVAWMRPSGKAMLEDGRCCTVYASDGMSNHSAPLYTRPAPQQADRQRVPTIEELTEKIASLLHGTYHCTRVWEAWNVGTMSEEDFGPVDESDTPAEIAAEIHAMLAAAPEAPAQANLCPDGLLPDGPVCPRCGIRRGPSGIDGGKWVHCPSALAQKGGDA